jgi:hypothetical protein
LLGRGEKNPQNIPVEIAGIQDEILTRDFRSSPHSMFGPVMFSRVPLVSPDFVTHFNEGC